MNSTAILNSVTALPRHEVERLLIKATGRTRTELLLGVEVPEEQLTAFDRLVDRRWTGEPLQYIEGRIPFGSVEVNVDERALIPRPETEQLYEIAVDLVSEPRVIVDLCTGSGNLALALKHTFPNASVYATDSSADAVELAEENARDTGLDITVLTGDLFEPLPEHLRGRVDLIVANPPYLAESELDDLDPQVRDHEPVVALVAGPTGDEVLAAIADDAGNWLAPGGTIVCEISEFRGPSAVQLFADVGGELREDLAGKDRFVIGTQLTSL